MFALILFLVCLIIAPQLWVPPIVGLPVDFLVYPLLMLSVVLSGRLPQFLRFTLHDLFLLGFVMWMALSGLSNGLTEASKEHFIHYFKWFLLYKLVTALLYDYARIRRFMYAIVVLVLILGIEVLQHRFSADGRGWAGQALAWIDPSVLEAGGKGRARWIGIFDGPGVFAVLFTTAMPFLLPMISRPYSKTRRLLAVLGLALMVVAIYFIGSRGGMLATFAVVALYVMIRIGVAPKTVITVGVLAAVLYSLAPSYLTTIRDESKSSQYRVEMWAEGLDMIKEAPVLGIGRGNFREYTGKLIAHNSAVEIVGEMGLVGFFLWLSFIYVCIKSVVNLRASLTDPKDKEFCLALILSVVGYIISAMFVTLEYETFYLLLAACAACGRMQEAPVSMARADYIRVGTIIVSSLIGLQIFVIMYLG